MTCSYSTDKILHEIIKSSNAFLQTSDFKQATRTVYDCCKNIIGSTAGYVALLSADKSENELLFLDMSGMQCSLNPNQPMPIRGLRAEAYSSGETVYDNNFPQSEWLHYLPEGHGQLDNVLFAPLIIFCRNCSYRSAAKQNCKSFTHSFRTHERWRRSL
jgi:hypothetical protein